MTSTWEVKHVLSVSLPLEMELIVVKDKIEHFFTFVIIALPRKAQVSSLIKVSPFTYCFGNERGNF